MAFWWELFVNQKPPDFWATFGLKLSEGYQPVSLSISRDTFAVQASLQEPPARFTSVWAKWSGRATPAHRAQGLSTRVQTESYLDEQAQAGFYPRLVAAVTAVDTKEVFYCVIVSRGVYAELTTQTAAWIGAPSLRSGIDSLGRLNNVRYDENWFPIDVAVYPWPSLEPAHFGVACIWQEQEHRATRRDVPVRYGHVYWNLMTVPRQDTVATAEALQRGFAQPRLSCPSDSNTSVMLYRDDAPRGVSIDLGVPWQDLQTTFDALVAADKWTLSVKASAFSDEQRFDVVSADVGQLEEPKRRLVVRHAFPGQPVHRTARATSESPLRATPDRKATVFAPTFYNVAPGSLPIVLSGGGSQDTPSAPPPDIEIGIPAPGEPPFRPFQAVDQVMIEAMKKYSKRAAQLAIVYQGRLVHAAAYTWSQIDYPVTEILQRMRWASVSKVITAMALAKVAEERGIDIFDPVEGNLGALLGVGAVQGLDQRTAAQVAYHVAYFSDELYLGTNLPYYSVPGGPVGTADTANRVPVTREDYFTHYVQNPLAPVGDNLGLFSATPPAELRPLPATPPEQLPLTSYSNFGYGVLQDVIRVQAALLGVGLGPYLPYVRDNLFLPAGVPPGRIVTTIGDTLSDPGPAHRTDEVRYHSARPVAYPSILRAKRTAGGRFVPDGLAPQQYDGTNFELALGPGAWALAAVDVVRLFSTFDRPDEHVFGRRALTWLSEPPLSRANELGHSLAWFERNVPIYEPGGGGTGTPNPLTHRLQFHTGDLPTNTLSTAFRREDGLVAAWSLTPGNPGFAEIDHVRSAIDQATVNGWPEFDLWDSVYGGS